MKNKKSVCPSAPLGLCTPIPAGVLCGYQHSHAPHPSHFWGREGVSLLSYKRDTPQPRSQKWGGTGRTCPPPTPNLHPHPTLPPSPDAARIPPSHWQNREVFPSSPFSPSSLDIYFSHIFFFSLPPLEGVCYFRAGWEDPSRISRRQRRGIAGYHCDPSGILRPSRSDQPRRGSLSCPPLPPPALPLHRHPPAR